MSEIKTVYAYLRCSSSKQDTSIPDQEKTVLPFIKKMKWKLLGTFIDEGKSGSKDLQKRQAFHQMMNLVDKGKADAVVCLNTSRFGRLDNIEAAEHKARLREAGTILYTMQDGVYDFHKSTDRIMSSLKEEGNNDYAKKISDASVPAKLKRLKEGAMCAAGGFPPYALAKKVIDPAGNVHIIKRNDRFTIPKEWQSPVWILGEAEEVEIVKWIFNQILKKDISYNGIARELNNRKIPSSHDKQWRDATIKGMLRNPIYAGASYIGKSHVGKFNRANNIGELKYGEPKKQNQTPELIIWNQFKAIIPKKDWLKVQQIMQDRKAGRKKPKSSGKQYPLTGILYCGACGRSMQGHTNKQLKEGKQVRYRCSCRPAETPECNGQVAEHVVLPIILDAVKDKIGELTAPKKMKQVNSNTKKLKAIDKKIESTMWKLKITDDKTLYLELQQDLKELRREARELSLSKDSLQCTETEALGCLQMFDFYMRPDVRDTEGPLKLLSDSIEGFKADHNMMLDNTIVEIPVFRQRMKELGLKIEIFFTDMGKDKKYGRWILDVGRVKLNFGVIDNAYGRRYRRDTEKTVYPGGGR